MIYIAEMTEIFYRLLSRATGNFYLIEKEVRFNLVKLIVDDIILKKPNDKKLVSSLVIAKSIYVKLGNMEAMESIPNLQRKELASQCLEIKKNIYNTIETKIEGIDYKGMSNQKYSNLLKSDITDYFYIALYMNECRGRLLTYLLKE